MSREGSRRNALREDSIKLVKAGSGCEDATKAEQVIIYKQTTSSSMVNDITAPIPDPQTGAVTYISQTR